MLINRIKKIIKNVPYIKKWYLSIKQPSVEETIDFLFKDKDLNLFVDVGANMGQTIDIIMKRFKKAKIYAFEPTPQCFLYLTTRYKNYENVNIINKALGEYNGNAKFSTSEFSATNSILGTNQLLYKNFIPDLQKVLEESNEINVDIIKFDDFYKNNLKNELIDLMKIDTQGYDYYVIEGARQIISEKVKVIIVENIYLNFYLKSMPYFKIHELLNELGFKLFNIVFTNRFNRFQLIESDCIFINSKFLNDTAEIKNE